MLWLEKPPAIIIPQPPRIERAMLPGFIPFIGGKPAAGPITNPVSLGTSQSVGNVNATTITMTTSVAILAGDLVVVVVEGQNNSTFASAVSDGTNSYTMAVRFNNGTTDTIELWYKANAAAVASGATLTATWPVNKNYRCIGGARCANANGGLDQTGSSLNTAITITPTTAKQIIFGAAVGFVSNSYTEVAPFTLIFANNANAVCGLGYDNVTSTASVTYNPSTGGSIGQVVASFKNG